MVDDESGCIHYIEKLNDIIEDRCTIHCREEFKSEGVELNKIYEHHEVMDMFFKYMCDMWNSDESIRVLGEAVGEKIWNTWKLYEKKYRHN